MSGSEISLERREYIVQDIIVNVVESPFEESLPPHSPGKLPGTRGSSRGEKRLDARIDGDRAWLAAGFSGGAVSALRIVNRLLIAPKETAGVDVGVGGGATVGDGESGSAASAAAAALVSMLAGVQDAVRLGVEAAFLRE